MDPGGILSIDCDILAPCALGGVIEEQAVEDLNCKMILGGANNQLAAHSQHDEIRMAQRVAEKGVLFVPDWIVNAGGVIQGKMEHVKAEAFMLEDALAEAEHVIPPNVKQVLHIARRDGITPVEAAYQVFERQIYG
jgi:glutamate dehydrogenase/leucine dehydrogenase